MNGLEKIIDKIKSDATALADETMAEAGKQAAEIAAEFDKVAGHESASVLERGKEQAAEIERRAISVAQLEARKALLAKKQELISAAFDKAMETLLSLDDAAYTDLLCKFAVKNSANGNEEILLNQKDRARIGKQVVINANQKLEAAGRPHNLTLSAESCGIDGGLLLKDGNIEINCALGTIVSMMRETLAREVAGALFS